MKRPVRFQQASVEKPATEPLRQVHERGRKGGRAGLDDEGITPHRQPSDISQVERLFSSYGRTKVLTVMLESGELNISEITRRSGLSHSSAARHLEFLTRSGLITEKRFNRIRIFRVDHSNPYVGVLNRFLSEWKRTAAAPLQRSFY